MSEFKQSDYAERLPPNLLELSEDLMSIFEQNFQSDIVLSVNGKDIRCHKDILSIRSKWFSLKICQASSSGITCIKINEKNLIMKAVLTYIYTGNLKVLESLNIPLIDLHNAVDKYGLASLKNIVTNIIKSKCLLNKAKSTEFVWNVEVDYNKSSISYCPALKNFSLHGSDKWGLEIHTITLGNGICISGIYLTREIVSEVCKIIHTVNISVQLTELRGTRRLLCKEELTVSEDGKYKIAEVSSKCEQRQNLEALSAGETLTLAFEVTVCGQSGAKECFQLEGVHRRYIADELNRLSQDMLDMLKMGKYSDTSLQLKGCSLFQLHSYIIFGRSRVPIPVLSRVGEITGFGSVVWSSFIFFMYTGQTRFLDDHMRLIYYALRKLNLAEPRRKYEYILSNNLNINNAFGILCDSVSNGDTYLMFSAAQFLACNSLIFTDPKLWISIASDNTKTDVFRNLFF